MTVLYFNGGAYFADLADCVNMKRNFARLLCKNCGSKVGMIVRGLVRFTIYAIIEPIAIYPICSQWNCENLKCVRRSLSLILLGRLPINPKKRLLPQYADVPKSILSYCSTDDFQNTCATIESYERVEYELFKRIIDSGIYDQPKNFPLLKEHLASTRSIYDVPKSMENHEVIYDIPNNIPINSVIEAIDSVVRSVTLGDENVVNDRQFEENLSKSDENVIAESETEKMDDEIIDLTSPCQSTCSSPRLVICESPEPVVKPRTSVRKDLFEEKSTVSSPNDGQIPGTSWRKEKIFEGAWLRSDSSNVIQGKKKFANINYII